MTKLSMSEEEMLKRKYTRPYEKRIAELEEKISILLSCKNCPENKGGLICAKEYENKCLAQKIQYIKELQEENAENESEARELNIRIDGLIKENAELKEELKDANKKVVHLACNQNIDLKRKINKAKEIIKNLMVYAEIDCREYEKAYKEAEQFLKGCK